jgi:hypothetical protein
VAFEGGHIVARWVLKRICIRWSFCWLLLSVGTAGATCDVMLIYRSQVRLKRFGCFFCGGRLCSRIRLVRGWGRGLSKGLSWDIGFGRAWMLTRVCCFLVYSLVGGIDSELRKNLRSRLVSRRSDRGSLRNGWRRGTCSSVGFSAEYCLDGLDIRHLIQLLHMLKAWASAEKAQKAQSTAKTARIVYIARQNCLALCMLLTSASKVLSV